MKPLNLNAYIRICITSNRLVGIMLQIDHYSISNFLKKATVSKFFYYSQVPLIMLKLIPSLIIFIIKIIINTAVLT